MTAASCTNPWFWLQAGTQSHLRTCKLFNGISGFFFFKYNVFLFYICTFDTSIGINYEEVPRFLISELLFLFLQNMIESAEIVVHSAQM